MNQLNQYSELFDIHLWKDAPKQRIEEIASTITEVLGSDFILQEIRAYDKKIPVVIPTFKEQASGLIFNLIPGGVFQMGFSEEEEIALMKAEIKNSGLGGGSFSLTDAEGNVIEEKSFEPNDENEFVQNFLLNLDYFRPVHKVSLQPFLLAKTVLSGKQAELWVDSFFSEDIRIFDEDEGIMYLFPEEIEQLLQKSGFRLPSEAEWEYACRAMSKTLFYWGNKVPDSPPYEQFNRFGLLEIGNVSELCADNWHDNYEKAPNDGTAWVESGAKYEYKNLMVSRGGAAAWYPWQDCGEWLAFTSSNRFSFDIKNPDELTRQTAVRLAKSLF